MMIAMHRHTSSKTQIMPFKNILYLLLSATALLYSGGSVAANNSEKIGDILQIALPLSAYGLTYFKKDKTGAIAFSKSFSTTIIATQLLKHTVHKQRPSGGNLSFPSGHTSAAFSAAGFMQTRYGLQYGIPAYIAATYVGWSRVVAKAHYTEDVLAGAALALWANYYFIDPFNNHVEFSILYDNGYFIAMTRTW